MVKRTQTVRRLLPTICLNVFDHFVGLALKGIMLQGIYCLCHLHIFVFHPLTRNVN